MIDEITLKKMDIREEISFFKPTPIECPACEKPVLVEELKTGAGRLDAGKLTDDLHRYYIATEEFGQVYPIIYQIATCNHCYFSAFKFDFTKLKTDTIKAIKDPGAMEERVSFVKTIFNHIPNFNKQKNLFSSLATYLLAIATYNQFSRKNAPTIRMAICTIRCAWICTHLKELGYKNDNIKFLIKMFYRKALFLYAQVLDLSMTAQEDYSSMPFLGPDSDKDFGHDGLIYLHAWLGYHYGNKDDIQLRIEQLKKIKTHLSKVFGFGKSSRAKPSVLLNVARTTYELMEQELRKIS